MFVSRVHLEQERLVRFGEAGRDNQRKGTHAFVLTRVGGGERESSTRERVEEKGESGVHRFILDPLLLHLNPNLDHREIAGGMRRLVSVTFITGSRKNQLHGIHRHTGEEANDHEELS